MTSLESVLQSENTAARRELHVSFELGDKSWKLSCGDGTRSPSRYSVNAGDQAAVLDCIEKARARCGDRRSAGFRSTAGDRAGGGVNSFGFQKGLGGGGDFLASGYRKLKGAPRFYGAFQRVIEG